MSKGAYPYRSSAEVFDIEREVNKHKKYQNSLSSFKRHNDPDIVKKNIQISMQLQLQNLVTKINDKEKQQKDLESTFKDLTNKLELIEKKIGVETGKLKKSKNHNVNLRTQINFLMQSLFGMDRRQMKMQSRLAKGQRNKMSLQLMVEGN